MQQEPLPQNDDIIQIEVSIPSSKVMEKKTELVKIHRTRDMKDLYAKIRRIIRDDGRWAPDIKDIKILYKNSIVSENISLKQAGIEKEAKVTVVYERIENAQVWEEAVKVPLRTTPVINERAPKMPKAGYVTSPSISDLQKMSTIELEGVKNFTISNNFGLIEYPG